MHLNRDDSDCLALERFPGILAHAFCALDHLVDHLVQFYFGCLEARAHGVVVAFVTVFEGFVDLLRPGDHVQQQRQLRYLVVDPVLAFEGLHGL